MDTPVRRSVVEAFYRAFASRDPAAIAPFIADDAKWIIVGPVDVLAFCGERRGKEAVLDLFRHVVPAVLRFTGFTPEILLVDGDRAATLSRVTAVQQATGRTISYRCSQFVHFRADQVIDFRSVIDSFDAAEQMLGHHIDLSPLTSPAIVPA